MTAEKLRGLIADNVFLDAGLVTASIGASELTAGDDLSTATCTSTVAAASAISQDRVRNMPKLSEASCPLGVE